jgi:ADP-ribosylglycohydrolase
MSTRSTFRGCLLGGALGDALGAPVEFLRLRDIRARFGTDGVSALEPEYGRNGGAITDDTQMTLFTAEALLRARHRAGCEDLADVAGYGYGAYLRWLRTQGYAAKGTPASEPDGWLVGHHELHAQRGPGDTCLSALRSGRMGTPEAPLNDSKGCGTVMRVAPVGLAAGPDESFGLGCELSAITHGHPSGWLSGGCLAEIVSRVARGEGLRVAAATALARLRDRADGRETVAAVEAALALAAEPGAPSPERVESLGGGWVAEEALAIGLYAALVAQDVESGLLLAVNHSGDSDSTGAIAGNLLGLVRGETALPERWLARLELRTVLERVADDLWAHFGDPADRRCDDVERYPA